jgi:hypothetical protein
MAKTAPLPVIRALTQPALHWIAVNIAKLFRELPLISDVEVVIAFLPVLRLADQSPGHTLL